MDLLSTLQRYRFSFIDQYSSRLSKDQIHALDSMLHCRSERYGEMSLHCKPCDKDINVFHSCGHRSCYRCQHHDTKAWLERQRLKLVPVNYFMVTFTLPFELRSLSFKHQKTVYPLLFQCAVETLKQFSKNDKNLGDDIGLTAVLHTHSRQLDFHPHVHIVIPGGCVNKKRKQWKSLKSKYLFNEFALARVFKGKLIAALKLAGLCVPATPKQWVSDCESVGKGLPALTYLARYLYRGVFSEKNLVMDDGVHVRFQYKDGKTGKVKTRTLKGEEFLWLILQHTLPKGFRRVRDYGFLHGNAKYLLKIIQVALGGASQTLTTAKEIARAVFKCPCCKGPMIITGFTRPRRLTG